MNERFNELRLDAGIAQLHDEPYLVAINKSGEIIDPLIGLEKFAELIVRECAGIVEDAVDHREPASTYVDKIKQHFGVEE